MRLSSIGLIGGALLIGAVSAAPSFAGTPASISGSASFISAAGFASTVSGESVLPSGFIYSTGAGALTNSGVPPAGPAKASLTNAAVIVLPQFSLQGFSVAAESLQVASSVAPTATTGSSSFSGASATILTNAAAATAGASVATDGRTVNGPASAGSQVIYASANIEFIAAIIKAGAGVNGLD